MATSFSKILAEVQSKSNPQRQSILKQISAIPGQQKAQESSLVAMKDQAYDDILSGARQRGLGFSGIPLGEQAQYNATQFAPAVANLKSGFNDRRSSLEQALAGIGQNNYMAARDIYDRERQFEEQRRQFDQQMRLQRESAARSAAASVGGASGLDYLSALVGSGGGGGSKPKATYQNNGGDFQFRNSAGKPITAAQFAKATNQPIGAVLRTMGQEGNETAAQLYNQLRNVANDKKTYNRALEMYKQRFPYVFGGV